MGLNASGLPRAAAKTFGEIAQTDRLAAGDIHRPSGDLPDVFGGEDQSAHAVADVGEFGLRSAVAEQRHGAALDDPHDARQHDLIVRTDQAAGTDGGGAEVRPVRGKHEFFRRQLGARIGVQWMRGRRVGFSQVRSVAELGIDRRRGDEDEPLHARRTRRRQQGHGHIDVHTLEHTLRTPGATTALPHETPCPRPRTARPDPRPTGR